MAFTAKNLHTLSLGKMASISATSTRNGRLFFANRSKLNKSTAYSSSPRVLDELSIKRNNSTPFLDRPLPERITVAVDVDEVLGNFVSALNQFIADRYALNHSISEYHVYEFFKGRYTYTYDASKGLSAVHHIVVSRSRAKRLMFRTQGLFVVTCCLVALLDKSLAAVFLSFAIAGFCLRFLLRHQIEIASVVIFPDLGVQLETLYTSGETVRRFVPIGKILKPVLNECVTPVTCY